MIVSEGVLVGGALGGVGAAVLKHQAWQARIAAGVFGVVAAFATTGLVIRYMEWPRETEIEIGVAFLVAVLAMAVAVKVLAAIEEFDLVGAIKSKFGNKREE